MENFIENDAFKYNVRQLLYPIDLYHLLITCKSLTKYFNIEDIKTNAIIQIEKELSELFGVHYGKFKKIFDEQNGIITGSIILRSIFGKKSFGRKVKIVAFVDGNKSNDVIIWKKFAEDIGLMLWEYHDGHLQTSNGSKTLKIILINTRQKINNKYDYLDKFCYKRKNYLLVPNIQLLLERKIHVDIFLRSYRSFWKYHENGFKFYDNGGILSNKEMCDILFEDVHIHVTQINKCEYIDACFTYGDEYYKTFKYDMCGTSEIRKCDMSEKCFVRVLSPDTNHFHDEDDGILIADE